MAPVATHRPLAPQVRTSYALECPAGNRLMTLRSPIRLAWAFLLVLAIVFPVAAQEAVPPIAGEPLPVVFPPANEAPAPPPAGATEAASTALDAGPLAGIPGHEAVEEGLRVVTQKGYFDYDEEHNTIYSNERTRVTYKGITLEADHINLDVGLSEIQAVGNVVLTRDSAEVHAERLDYNFRDQTGSAYKPRATSRPCAFTTPRREGSGHVPPREQ